MSEITVKVGLASCGVAAGAMDVYNKLTEYLAANKLPVKLLQTACIGMCFEEPIVEFSGSPLGQMHVGKADPESIVKVMEDYLAGIAPQSNVILAEKLGGRHNAQLRRYRPQKPCRL